MSVCIEQCNYPSNQNNFSQHLPAADMTLKLPRTSFPQKSIFALVKIWYARNHQRKHLAQLDERMLKDIGCTPSEARTEYIKPFWK